MTKAQYDQQAIAALEGIYDRVSNDMSNKVKLAVLEAQVVLAGVLGTIILVLWTVLVAMMAGSPAPLVPEAKAAEARWYTHYDWEAVTQCVSSYPVSDRAAGEKCLGKVLRDGEYVK